MASTQLLNDVEVAQIETYISNVVDETVKNIENEFRDVQGLRLQYPLRAPNAIFQLGTEHWSRVHDALEAHGYVLPTRGPNDTCPFTYLLLNAVEPHISEPYMRTATELLRPLMRYREEDIDSIAQKERDRLRAEGWNYGLSTIQTENFIGAFKLQGGITRLFFKVQPNPKLLTCYITADDGFSKGITYFCTYYGNFVELLDDVSVYHVFQTDYSCETGTICIGFQPDTVRDVLDPLIVQRLRDLADSADSETHLKERHALQECFEHNRVGCEFNLMPAAVATLWQKCALYMHNYVISHSDNLLVAKSNGYGRARGLLEPFLPYANDIRKEWYAEERGSKACEEFIDQAFKTSRGLVTNTYTDRTIHRLRVRNPAVNTALKEISLDTLRTYVRAYLADASLDVKVQEPVFGAKVIIITQYTNR
jgi:hypothetical protein